MTTHKEALDKAGYAFDWNKHGDWPEDFTAAIRAYLDARGLVMVPKEPTHDMADAYWEQTGESELMRERVKMRAMNMYYVMLSAAPDPFKE